MTPKVSIIVPLYNAENNVRKCLDSILAQTLKDIEIILVNDGSPDRSGIIAEEYKRNDSRIKVIHQSNQGVAYSRNRGLSVAKGEYIGFVDADDWIEDSMYYEMYNLAKNNNADIVMCGYTKHSESKAFDINEPIQVGTYKSNEILKNIIEPMIGTFDKKRISWTYRVMGSVWRNLFRRELIKSQDIYFDNSLSYSEDLLFCIECLLKSKKVLYTNKPFYNYRISENSLSHGYVKDLFHNLLKVDFKIRFLLSDKLNKEILDSRTITIAKKAILNEIDKENPNSYNKKINNIKSIVNNKEINNIFSRMNLKGYKFNDKFVFWCIKNKFAFLLFLFYKIRGIIKRVV